MSKNTAKFLTHLIAIGMIFVLPEVMMSIGNTQPHPMAWVLYLKAAVYVGVFYAEYYVVLRTHSLNWRFITGNVALMAVAMALLCGVMTIMRHFDAGGRGEHAILPMMVRDVAMVTLTMALGVAVKTTERMRQIEETRRTDELKHLKSQLNPHFLFNSLNTIYALTGLNADRARDAIHKLSRLLRYTLYEAEAPMVPLQRELNFVADYVRLMEMRIGSAMKINMTLDAATRADVQVAPMLFVSLIENAFKHGNTGLADAFVDIDIRADERHGIICRIVNSVAHSAASPDLPGQSTEMQSGGVGLVNLRRRLQLIYAGKAQLEIKQDDATFSATLTLNI